MRLLPTTAFAIAALLSPLPLLAQDDAAETALEARQGFMEMLGINMGVLAGMAKGDTPYDEAAAATAGANIEALSRYALPGLFLEGTSTDDLPDDTAALPAVWKDNATFTTRFADFTNAAAGAGEAVKGGQEAVGPVVQKLGATCKACHDTFRKPE
ncbi:c-type cytochrome [Paracoccus pacificus]|uniref:C-type cytochrome n=1 Tax=Paracoccus pacificus TaxID=1463598 RepID=A0ABW4RAF1_9RHOB